MVMMVAAIVSGIGICLDLLVCIGHTACSEIRNVDGMVFYVSDSGADCRDCQMIQIL